MGPDLAELLFRPPRGTFSCGREDGWTAEERGGETEGEGGGEKWPAFCLSTQLGLEEVIWAPGVTPFPLSGAIPLRRPEAQSCLWMSVLERICGL